ncbi:hypothetical protein B5S33_g3766 [[Candida] boidinii]|nr:hypothetical protein B5S33_g3766 [[Candida] boidinii]
MTKNTDNTNQNGDESQEEGLFRVASRYTEYSMANGEAEIEAENETRRRLRSLSKSEGVENSKLPMAPPPPPPRYGFFAKENKLTRLQFFKEFPTIILVIENRYTNLKILVVGEDMVDGQYPLLSQALIQTGETSPLNRLLGWEYHNRSEILEWANRDGKSSVEEECIWQVHKQDYWGTIYLPNGSETNELQQIFANANTQIPIARNLVRGYYESGRDFVSMGSTVTPSLLRFDSAFAGIAGADVYPQLINNLTDSQKDNLIQNGATILSDLPMIALTDGRPVTDPVVLAPSQVGLIYIVILTFFQFMWFIHLHGEMGKKLTTVSYIVYRIVVSQIAFLFLSLAYSCVSAAFQVTFSNTWKGGFGVQWMFTFLTMSAVGGANENVALLAFPVLPPLMGFWLLFWVIINIAPTFSPIALCPKFFRYGYAMPIHNSYEATKVLLFDTYRGQLGRNIGILIAYIVINIAIAPLCIMFASYKFRQQAMAQAKARLENEAKIRAEYSESSDSSESKV